jgi:hypothetical protein
MLKSLSMTEDDKKKQETIDWGVKNKIFNGQRVDEPATRYEMVQMLKNYDIML